MFNLHKKTLPKITRVMDMCPILGVASDQRTTYTKDGLLSQVIEVSGRDYTGVTEDVLSNLYAVRKEMFENSLEYVVSIFSLRSEYSPESDAHDYGNDISNEIIQTWSKTFSRSYRTRHFMLIRTRTGDILNRMVKGLEKGGRKQSNAERLSNLTDFCMQATARLKEFRARLLAGDELASFWGWLINGEYKSIRMPDNHVFDDLFVGKDIYFPNGKKYMEYHGNNDRYSAFLAIGRYSSDTKTRLLDILFHVQQEFSLVQSFDVLEKQKALSVLDDKIKHHATWTDYGQEILNELLEIISAVQSDRLKVCRHRFGLQVFGNTPEQLEAAVKIISAAIETTGILPIRETMAIEPLYWSQFPGLEALSVREREITTENLTDLITFSTLGEGQDTCSWGPMPTAMFKTLGGSEYSFTFHKSEAELELGHTLIIGGSNSGKTTLINFLQTNALKYPGMKILNFDRLHGMEVATRMQNGAYEDFIGEPLINPLHLTDTPINRAFLTDLLGKMSGKTDDEHKQIIANAIDSGYGLSKDERTLENLALAFGIKDDNSVMAGMEKWLPGGEYGQFFTGKKDSLDFSKPIVSFDMTSILNSPNVLSPMASYLFHRLENLIQENPTPFIIFIDELRNYLRAPAFLEQFNKAAQEYRKLNGVLIGAMQDADHIYKDENGRQSLNNFATFILYPAARADKETYMEGFGLTETEFNWIKQPHNRQVMIKRKEGESTVLNIDLSPLGNYLNVYDSAATAVQKINKLRKEGGDWRRRYLGVEYAKVG